MKKRYLLIGIILVIFLVTALFDIFRLNKASSSTFSMMAGAPVVDEIVVYVPLAEANKTVTVEDIKKGEYPIEAIEVGPGQFIVDGPQRFGHFWRFDTNHDGVLDATDPFYQHLALGLIGAKGKTIHFVFWRNAGLRSMVLDPNHLTPYSKQGLPIGFWDMRNTIILSDGSKWITQHIPVSTTFIDQLKTTDNNQQLVKPQR